MAVPRALAALSSLGAALAACDVGFCEEDVMGATHLLQTQVGPRRQSPLKLLSLHGPHLPPVIAEAVADELLGPPPAFMNWTDMNGQFCMLCGTPQPGRSDREYVQRTDCGNQSVFAHPQNRNVPVVQFNREAKDGQPETTAWCELNIQKVCADSIYNKDFLMQAKFVEYPKNETYDRYYCKHNGWLSPEIRALQHDFEGMKARAEEECSSRQYDTITLAEMSEVYGRGMKRGQPTPDEAMFIGAWTCGMGSAGCDMAYCAYTFCELPDGSIGGYDECEGWDPVKGMPVP